MKKLQQSPLHLFLICFFIFLTIYMLSSLNQGATQLIPNEEQILQATYPASNAAGFYNNQININTASVELLSMLPGIGKTIAEEIVSYRQANGPFKSIQELELVRGLGEKTIENIVKYITVGGQS